MNQSRHEYGGAVSVAACLWAGMRFEMQAVTAFRERFRDYRRVANIGAMNSPLLVFAGIDSDRRLARAGFCRDEDVSILLACRKNID